MPYSSADPATGFSDFLTAYTHPSVVQSKHYVIHISGNCDKGKLSESGQIAKLKPCIIPYTRKL